MGTSSVIAFAIIYKIDSTTVPSRSHYTQVFNTTAQRAVVLKIGSIKIDGIIYGSIDGIINNKLFARCAVSPTGANHFQKSDFQSPFLGGSLPYRGEPFSESQGAPDR